MKGSIVFLVLFLPGLVFGADDFGDLCYSETQIKIENEKTVLNGFNFDPSCIYDDGDNDGVKREIALRLRYSKSGSGKMIFSDKKTQGMKYLYINIRASNAPGFISREISIREEGGTVIGQKDGMQVITGMKYTDKDVLYVNSSDRNYFYWCVEGGACGVVSSLDEDSLINYEIVIPSDDFDDLFALKQEVKSLLTRRMQR